MNEITTAITTVGFPIIAYLLLFLSMRSDLRDNTNAINALVNTLERRLDDERKENEQ